LAASRALAREKFKINYIQQMHTKIVRDIKKILSEFSDGKDLGLIKFPIENS